MWDSILEQVENIRMLGYAMLRSLWMGRMIEVLTVALSIKMNKKDVHYGDARLFPYAMVSCLSLE